MFDLLPKPALPSDLHASLASWCFIAPMTTDSALFPDSSNPRMHKPDVDSNCGLYTSRMSQLEEDDGLELSLGLSLGSSFSKVRKSDDVKPLGLNPKLQKEPREQLSLCAEASMPAASLNVKAEAVMHDEALSTEGRPVQSYVHGRNEDRKKFEFPIHPCRDQVWQALQKSSAVSVKGSMHAESATAFRELKDASTPLWSRRSTSMQLMEVVKEGSEAAPQSIKRSTSSCVPINMMAQQLLNGGSAPLSRQVSSVECLLEKHPETPTFCEQQQALELQRKKEMQAKRRQEARKRRKSLIEEKQQKKAKRDERICIPQTKSTMSDSSQKNSSASATTQDASCPRSQNSGPRRLGSKEWVQSSEKPSVVGVSWAECSNDQTEGEDDAGAQDVSLDLEKADGKERRKRAPRGREVAEGSVAGMKVQQGGDGKSNLLQGGGRKPKMDRRSDSVQMATTTASLNCDAKHEAEGNMCKDADEGDGGVCSETESWESKGEHSSVQQNESGELEASSTPYAAQSSSHGGSFFPPSNNYFPVLPIPYPFHLPASSSTTLPLQMGFSLPCFMQYPPPAVGENPTPTSSQLPVSSSMNPYPLPMPDGPFPWFPLVPAATAAAAQSSCALPLNSSTSKEFQMQHPRGKLNEDAEKSSAVASPLQWTNSSSNIKEVAAHLNTRAPAPAPQPCSVGEPRDTRPETQKASTDNRNVRAQRQKKLSLAGPTLPEDTGAVEQSLSLQMDDHISHPNRPCKLGESRPSKYYSREPKQEEGSADSQLASELSGQEGSNVQPGVIENEKCASILDLPWVSTTGVGPNGKTINGVMYISKSKQVRLVCSCHGNHMSPTEFVEHSGSTDLSNPERSIVVNPFPFLNQLATTPV